MTQLVRALRYSTPLVLSALAVAPQAVRAQTAVVPSRTGPTREEIERFDRPAPAPSRLTIEGGVERSPCALADPAYAGIEVTLTSVEFNHLEPVAAAEVLPVYAQYLGAKRAIGVVCDIRDAVATVLRRKGYLAAVQVPTQRIENGHVRFEVLYAKLTTVRVRGDAGRSAALVARYLSHLTDGQVFNRFAAERYLLLARDIPGFDVRLALKPAGTAPGDMVGEVTVRRTPVEVDANVQNYAPNETGSFGGQLRAQFFGLTGLGDRTMVSAYTTADVREQQVVQIGHDMLVGGQGLRIGGRFTYAWTRPSLGAATPDVFARTLFANAEASYPLVRTQAASINAAIGFDFVNQSVRFGTAPLSLDRLRVGYVRVDGVAIDMRGVGPGGTTGWHLSGALELRRGLSIFGASPNCLAAPAACAGAAFVPPSLVDGNPAATVFRISGSAELRVGKTLSVAIQSRAQLASDALFAFEQFSAGNYTVGRGYPPGTLTGDDGIGFSIEARLDPFRLGSSSRVSTQPYGFVDNAWVWNRYGPAGSNPQKLSSVGAGVRVALADRARLDLTLAVPTRTSGAVRAGDVRFLMSLTMRLVPWSTR
jgi:hemolysin activation/secretion protein